MEKPILEEANAFAFEGDCLYRLSLFEDAIQCYDKYLEKFPLDSYILSNKACILKILGRTNEAMQYYEKIIQVDSSFIKDYIKNGFNEQSTNQNDMADLRECIENPQYDHYWSDNCISDLPLLSQDENLVEFPLEYPDIFEAPELGDYDLMKYNIEDIDPAVCDDFYIKKELEELQERVGSDKDYLDRSDIDRSYDNFKILLSENEEKIDGIELFRLGMYEDAIDYFDEQIQLNPKNIYAINNKSRSFLELGNLRASLECASTAIDLSPNYIPALISLGIAQFLIGQNKAAITSFNKILKCDPFNSAALINLELIHLQIGDNETAIIFARANRLKKLREESMKKAAEAQKHRDELNKKVNQLYETIDDSLKNCSRIGEGSMRDLRREIDHLEFRRQTEVLPPNREKELIGRIVALNDKFNSRKNQLDKCEELRNKDELRKLLDEAHAMIDQASRYNGQHAKFTKQVREYHDKMITIFNSENQRRAQRDANKVIVKL